MNSPIQGTAADIIKIAMVKVNQRLKEEHLRSRLILQIHDELLVEAYKEEAGRVAKIMVEEMQGAAELSVVLEAEVKEGSNWFEAK
jgi:DNA polymerase-1